MCLLVCYIHQSTPLPAVRRRVTVEELEEQLKHSHTETAAAREQVTSLTQQLATSIPRAEALVARRDLERRIETLTRYSLLLSVDATFLSLFLFSHSFFVEFV